MECGGSLAVFGGTQARMEDDYRKRGKQAQQLELVQQPTFFYGPITLSGGAGSLFTDGPSTGLCWSIRRLSLTGYSAGTVTLQKNSSIAGADLVFPPSVAGVFQIGRGEALFQPDEILVFVATGITLSANSPGVTISGTADSFPAWMLPRYLGVEL